MGVVAVASVVGCGTNSRGPDAEVAPQVEPVETRGLTPEDTPPAHEATPTLGRFAPLVDPDPNYQDALDNAQFHDGFWTLTDFSRHTVPLREIMSGGPPPDGIPAINDPQFVPLSEADSWLRNEEPVVAIEIEGDARAYPLQILIYHEIVNDVVGGVPVMITFCPLCNSAVMFERTVDGEVLSFGTTGNLRNSDLIMYDRQTQSWWQQITGEGIVGLMAGRQLTFLPASIISWPDFKAAYPDGKVLSKDTGYRRDYGINPYRGYDKADKPPIFFDGVVDGRLPPKERIVAVTLNDVDVAFPFTILKEERVVTYRVGQRDMVVFFQDGAQSALDSELFGFSKDVGSTGVFDPVLEGRELGFSYSDGRIIDDQTGSAWNILGHAVAGELVGKMLTQIIHGNHFWFAWAAFKPSTIIYPGR